MNSKWFAAALCGVVLAGLAPGLAHTEAAARPNIAQQSATIVPYLSHGAGVWVDRATGRPVSQPGSGAAPATPGVHYARP